ncbi:MAG: hypothetical protein HQL01_00385 [Nitrospirae bacterium]|nr:hypothetical protein [Nitrospirota bacterium]
MKKTGFTILMLALASCANQSVPEAKDPYAGLWNMLVLSQPPEIKPLKEDKKFIFKDASHSKGKGKIVLGTA